MKVWIFAKPPAPTPPSITTQPANQTITNGQTATLTVAASGPAPLSYQWYQGVKSTTSSPVGTNSTTFTTPALTASTSYWVRVTNPYGFVDSNTAVVTVSNPGPQITSVSNAASNSPTIAANTWVQIKGTNLATNTRQWQGSDFAAGQMPIQLDGVSALVNGKNAYIYYISPTQVNILTPPDTLQGAVQVQLTSGGVAGNSFPAQAQALSPSFFEFGGGPYLAATHLSGAYLGPTNLNLGIPTTPAKPGETVVLYGNGFGPTTVPVAAGSVVQTGTLPSSPLIMIGGLPATVQFAGLISPGLFQFNVIVPNGVPDGDNAVVATYAGVSTQAGALLNVAH